MEKRQKLNPRALQLVISAIELEMTEKDIKRIRKEAKISGKKPTMRAHFQEGRIDNLRVLHYAVLKSHKLLFDILLEELRVNPTIPDPVGGATALHQAAVVGHNEMIDVLVTKYLCSIEARHDGGSTPLSFAVLYGQTSSLTKLLQYGASPAVCNFAGYPSHFAAYTGNISALSLLHKANPDVSTFELHGFCAPIVAAAFGASTGSVKYLANFSDINMRPLMYKIISCSPSEQHALECIDILLELGSDPNLFDQYFHEELPII